MALHPCRDCGTEFSTEAPACPKCGAPTATAAGTKKRRRIISRIFWGWTLLWAALLLYTWMTTTDSYDELVSAGTPGLDGAAYGIAVFFSGMLYFFLWALGAVALLLIRKFTTD